MSPSSRPWPPERSYLGRAATERAPHVRRRQDLAGVLQHALVALGPCLLFGLYNTGYQANRVLHEHGLEPGTGWRESLLGGLGAGRDPGMCE